MKLTNRLGRWLLCLLAISNTGNALHAEDDVRPFPDGWRILSAAAVTGYVTQNPVRDELNLTEDQQKRISQLRDELQAARLNVDRRDFRKLLEEATAASDAAQIALADILTPDQCRRHLQIVLQQMLVSGRGIVGLLDVSELSDVFTFDAAQREELETIQNEMSSIAMERMRANRPEGVILFSNVDLSNRSFEMHDLAEQENQRVAAVLTVDQKKRILDRLGRPLAGRLLPVPIGSPPPAPPVPGAFPVPPRMPRMNLAVMRRPTASIGPAASLGGVALSESPLMAALLSIKDVQEELKVAPERVQEEVLLGGDEVELTRCIKKLDQWLEMGQLTRLRQLALQVALERSGPAAVFEFREVVEALHLAEDQRSSLALLVQQELNSNRHALLLVVEPDLAKRHDLEKELSDRLNGLLNAEQRDRLSALLGEPHRGARPLSLAAIELALHPRMSARARTTVMLGQLTLSNPLLLRMAPVHDELQLSDEQRSAIGNDPTVLQNRDKLNEILSENQLRRYNEILLQGEARREGPCAVFRCRSVIDGLAPNEDQQRRLLEIIQEDTRAYLKIRWDKLAEMLPDLDLATAAKLESALTDEQREKLARLLGEPAKCLDEPFRPAVVR